MSERLRILAVEDSPSDTDLIREMLPETGPAGFLVVSVTRLSLALARLTDRDIDLILLDLGLPDSQGLATLRQLHRAAPEVPVIVLTGTDDQELGVAAMQEGAQDYLVKGQINQSLLVRSIRYARARHGERNRAEAAHARLVTAVEQAAETIVITDLRGVILYANPAFEKTTGYTRTEALSQNPRILKSGQHDAEFYRQMWQTLGRGETWCGHFVNRRKDGSLYEEEATISPVRDAAGAIINYVAVKRDVTREVHLNAQVRQMQKMEAVGQLAGGVAHDFNNILTALNLQTSMLEMADNLPLEVREGLEQIRLATNSAADLTRQLLMFGRRQVMQLRPLDLNTVVARLAKMLQRLIGEDVRLQLHLHPVSLLICADTSMMEQVLMNLAVNARDAMPRGGRLLITTGEALVDETFAAEHPDARPGNYACLSVNDTGDGIPPEVLPQIFEPFFTTKAVGKGTGLGLATVYGIVKQHQGWIKVDSQPGQGATFRVFLPATTAPAAPSPPARVPANPHRSAKTILMVEDEPAIRVSMRKLLERSGYQVLEAVNGIDALNLWLEHQGTVALLLTDLVMPGGVSGQELARRLKSGCPQLKIVYISGYNVGGSGQNLSLADGDKFVQKPFAPDQLLHLIRDSLET
jgi:PAS domain S-box-containing protein